MKKAKFGSTNVHIPYRSLSEPFRRDVKVVKQFQRTGRNGKQERDDWTGDRCDSEIRAKQTQDGSRSDKIEVIEFENKRRVVFR